MSTSWSKYIVTQDVSHKTDFDLEGRVMKMNAKNLDSVSREENAAILSNAIIQNMRDNNMTLENLDEACEIVREAYRKNAIIKG